MFNDKRVSLKSSSSMFLDDYKNIHVDTRFFLYFIFLSLKFLSNEEKKINSYPKIYMYEYANVFLKFIKVQLKKYI